MANPHGRHQLHHRPASYSHFSLLPILMKLRHSPLMSPPILPSVTAGLSLDGVLSRPRPVLASASIPSLAVSCPSGQQQSPRSSVETQPTPVSFSFAMARIGSA